MTDSQQRELVKELRTLTEYPFLECRKALEACSWDIDKAKSYLRQKTQESMKRFGGILDG